MKKKQHIKKKKMLYLMHQTTTHWMGRPPHKALLPGVGPIQVATSRVLLVPKEV